MILEPSLFFTAPLESSNGYTWTLASRLGDMLHQAQEFFGQRDKSYTILGVEFGTDNPRIWYPGNRKDVIIQLSPSAAESMARACYQLAHETVHLLSPSGANDANNFEEGIACYFAALYMRIHFKGLLMQPEVPSYLHALALVGPRLSTDIHCIQRLRSHEPCISRISREDLAAEFPDLTASDVDFLASKFVR